MRIDEENGKSCSVYLFRVFRPTREFFTYMVTLTGEGLQILTSTQHTWSFRSNGSLVFNTYCDKFHPLIMVFFRGSGTLTYVTERL